MKNLLWLNIGTIFLSLGIIATVEQVTGNRFQMNSPAVAQTATVPAKIYAENGIAIKGTDPVAYFQQGKAVAGSDRFTYRWGNATWKFSSTENRALFAKNPAKYAPQYGGFCAWAVSEGDLAPIDPNAWTIVNGKLYLNYSPAVQQQWAQDIPGNIAKADKNWPKLSK